ncbi:hypothetical protein [Alkalihalobacterium alkalinitrilicum]|uniref:hypothetical protein n=1 Tax=Alkalihalobacterium alkalinitrilicum TaxID=427920 RepID=UPI00114FABD2|nr:hypothetical protein [Alkalihalobacterium alkalinitrilicum]
MVIGDCAQEIEKEIIHFFTQYKGDFYTVFPDVLSGKKDKFDLEEPDDFTVWKDLLEDLAELFIVSIILVNMDIWLDITAYVIGASWAPLP